MTFASFYQRYPRKIGRGAARVKYERALKLASHEEIMEGLERFIEAEPWHGDLKFCPHPATWLYQERWADVYEESRPLDPWERDKYMDEFRKRKGLDGTGLKVIK